jgi:hypothetical protein
MKSDDGALRRYYIAFGVITLILIGLAIAAFAPYFL